MLMWWKSAVNLSFFLSFATCRMRSSACDTLTRLCVRHVLCWSAFPLVPALGSTGSAAFAPADRLRSRLFRFVRRLHSYYGGVRLLVSVHHRLRLLAFPMRTAVLSTALDTDGQTRDLPGSDAIPLHVMWPLTPAGRQHLA